MKVVFLLPVAGHARYHKRIEALQKLGVEPKILAFERDYYAGKAWSGGYKSLGKLQHGHYCKRLIPLLKAVPKVRAAVKEADIIYAFDLDVLLFGWLASRSFSGQPKIIYEVGDIREVLLGKRLVARSLRWLERFLLQRTNLLVVTSKAFVSEYYRGIQGLTDLCYQVIENKLDPDVLRQVEHKARDRSSEVLRIGYFGVLRCPRSWEILKAAARKGGGKIKLYVRGIPVGIESLEEEAEAIPYIDYGGAYTVSNELADIYGSVDMVWACYPYQGTSIGNWQWARTNRFYEACYFQKPMIAQVGTQDGQVIEELGLGICLDLSDIEGAARSILEISDTDLERWRANIGRLPEKTYTYTNEHEQLLEALAQ